MILSGGLFHRLLIFFPTNTIIFSFVIPNQVPAQHTWKGIFNLLIDPDDLIAIELRRRYVFKMIPMLNPDGNLIRYCIYSVFLIINSKRYVILSIMISLSVFIFISFYHIWSQLFFQSSFSPALNYICFNYFTWTNYVSSNNKIRSNQLSCLVCIISLHRSLQLFSSFLIFFPVYSPLSFSLHYNSQPLLFLYFFSTSITTFPLPFLYLILYLFSTSFIGVYRGHFRMDQMGENLNRYYCNPNRIKQPSIFAAKSLIEHYAQNRKLCFYLDLHAHASKRGCFIYGNVLEDVNDQIQNQLYCKLISLNSAHFEYEACLFNREHMKRVDPGDMLKGSHIRIFYFSLYSAVFNDVYFFYILPPTAFLLLLFFSFLFFLFFSIIFQQCVFSLSFLKRFSFLI